MKIVEGIFISFKDMIASVRGHWGNLYCNFAQNWSKFVIFVIVFIVISPNSILNNDYILKALFEGMTIFDNHFNSIQVHVTTDMGS